MNNLLKSKQETPIDWDTRLVSSNKLNTALLEPVFPTDRCLSNLLMAEGKYCIEYYFSKQVSITPEMREIVTQWMMMVCEENKCQEEVILLAVNYMDRFLSDTTIDNKHFQILAAASLLLASKLREPKWFGLSADLLVSYTGNSITKVDLFDWERTLAYSLNWDLSTVTLLDFLELLLSRLPFNNEKCPDVNANKIRMHVLAFIFFSCHRSQFLQVFTQYDCGVQHCCCVDWLELVHTNRNPRNISYKQTHRTDCR